MEKKRTKIAYFTAVGVFLVLLVVLGLTYHQQNEEYTDG